MFMLAKKPLALSNVFKSQRKDHLISGILPSICMATVSHWTVRRILMKFYVEIHHKILSSETELSENPRSGSHAVVKGVNDFQSVLSTFIA